ncbi:MAG: periplasmic heavy metal sensor, partial [Bdellovibrionales bacterium]|nr:periplasmic heavy metal sensor [Bdellovibrionales bacterium]
MKTKHALILVTTLLLTLPVTGLTQPMNREHPRPGGRFSEERGMPHRPMGQHLREKFRGRMDQGKERLFEELNLSDEQKQTLKGIKENWREKVTDVREKLQTAKNELRTSLRDPDQGSSEARPLLDRVTHLSSKLNEARIAMLLEIKDQLTKEQRAKAVRLMEHFKDERGGGMRGP